MSKRYIYDVLFVGSSQPAEMVSYRLQSTNKHYIITKCALTSDRDIKEKKNNNNSNLILIKSIVLKGCREIFRDYSIKQAS